MSSPTGGSPAARPDEHDGCAQGWVWRLAPLIGLVAALGESAIGDTGELTTALRAIVSVLELVVLMTVVFASAHHADVIAHRTGEPYGTPC